MFNKLVFWLALGFLIYILASTKFDLDKARQPDPQAPVATTPEPATQQPADKKSMVDDAINNLLEGKLPVGIKQNLEPITPTGPQNVKDTKAGDGNIAVCGSQVEVLYSMGSSKDTPEKFTIGERKAPPGVEQVVRGMKEHGERTADLPPALAANNMALAKNPYASTKPVPLTLELLKASPQLSYEPHSIQLFDKELGNGDPALCYDTVRVHYIVRTLDGKQVVDTEMQKLLPLTVTLGQGKAPVGIEEALVGLREGGVRTAILFPEVMKRLSAENQAPLANEQEYPSTGGLIFEFKRIANN